jgi:hypothetical protein
MQIHALNVQCRTPRGVGVTLADFQQFRQIRSFVGNRRIRAPFVLVQLYCRAAAYAEYMSRAIYEYLEEIVLRLYMGLDLELSCIIV